MNNKDKPAFPIINSEGFPTLDFKFEKDANDTTVGLTKREYYAGLAMQGLCVTRYTSDDLDIQKLAKKAVIITDELLKQLES